MPRAALVPAAGLLDFGGGVGTDSLAFSAACGSVTYCDVAGVTLNFASRRFRRHGARIAVTCVPDSYGALFDAVVAFEVLEHLADPIGYLRQLVSVTKPGGKLFLTESFGLVSDDYPSHLRENKTLAGKLSDMLGPLGCRETAKLEGRISVFTKGPQVTVIMPVHNAEQELRGALESISGATMGYPARLLIIDDASTNPDVAATIGAFKDAHAQFCDAIASERNLGFVQTCNRGMELAGSDDVILLNSDVIVYDNWIRRLVEAAYEDKCIGTVTPLSNSASGFSVLGSVHARNDVTGMLRSLGLAAIDVPTGVGFCLYVKRIVIDSVGMFDPVFGRGYGEETDLCQRAAAAGYRNIVTPSAFIYHSGGASMVAAGIRTRAETTLLGHERIIDERHPRYRQAIADIIASQRFTELGEYLSWRYVQYLSARRPSVALVVHTDAFARYIGGTEHHVLDLVAALDGKYLLFVISPAGENISVDACADGARVRATWNHADYETLLELLSPSILHIHHLMNYPEKFIEAAIRWRGPKVYTIHDYFGLCPSCTLLNYNQVYCELPPEAECVQCAAALFGDAASHEPARLRRLHQRLVDNADAVIAPSHSALATFTRAIHVRPHQARVIPHALAYRGGPAYSRPALLASSPRLRVGFIGYNAVQKGSHIVAQVISQTTADPFDYVSVGNIAEGSQSRRSVQVLGLYARESAVDLLRESRLDVVVIASPWPETFSYTLSEAWAAGIPVVAGPLGAPAERIAATGAGLVTASYEPGEFVRMLRLLQADRELLAKISALVPTAPHPSDMGPYDHLYSALAGGARTRTPCLLLSVPCAPAVASGPGVWEAVPPIVEKLAEWRRRAVPVGSARERLYFALHNRVTRQYAGGIEQLSERVSR